MTEWKPRYRKRGIHLPFGYFVSPIDPDIIIPDPAKCEALEHSFRMRAKYRTAIRDCCQWLHQQTGQRMSPAGYLYAYRAWVKRVKKLNGHAFAVKKKKARKVIDERKKFIEENFKQFAVKLDDSDSVTALAEYAAIKDAKAV